MVWLLVYREILSSFADPVIMLFLGGFVLAICANKVGIDKYLARTMLRVFGTRPHFILLGLLLVNGIFSMFMSNTATAAMMLAFLAPMLAKMPEQGNGRVALALAIPIAANIGGLGTPIGTPPNAIALGQLAKMGCDIGFGTWMMPICTCYAAYFLGIITAAISHEQRQHDVGDRSSENV